MRRSSRFQKWASGFLGLACLALIANLVLRSGTRVGASRSPLATPAAASAARSQTPPARGGDELARYDPIVRLEVLKELRSRRAPKLARNPFEFEPERVVRAPSTPGAPAAPPAPPPPPPITLKVLGYTEKEGGVREAILFDDEQIYIVHEGETFAKKYRVLGITAKHVEIQDESTQQTARLPIAQ